MQKYVQNTNNIKTDYAHIKTDNTKTHNLKTDNIKTDKNNNT